MVFWMTHFKIDLENLEIQPIPSTAAVPKFFEFNQVYVPIGNLLKCIKNKFSPGKQLMIDPSPQATLPSPGDATGGVHLLQELAQSRAVRRGAPLGGTMGVFPWVYRLL